MSDIHRDPLYQRNARLIRRHVNREHAGGRSVQCIGCGRPITPGQTFDIGHIIDGARGGSSELTNLGPQHRRENRRSGGRLGAALTNRTSRRAQGLPTW